MSTTSRIKPSAKEVKYPTRDGRPMGETDVHRDNMMFLVWTLRAYFATDPNVYVSGNLLMFYVPGDKRRHLSPDVFVIRGVRKGRRLNYLIWEEGKGPDFVIEVTSKSTRKEDLDKKFLLYRDTLKVPEYFLFDPYEEYLVPSLQGFRLVDGRYESIVFQEGRLPSAVLGLELVRNGTELRLFDPKTRELLPTADENAAALDQTAAALDQTAAALDETTAALRQRDAEIEQLRQEIARLKGGAG
ncbi:MAG: Uma2 family endonuclease [Isosphaeraceae bacterium]|nr:Uma2 family endonuclease [Isosphaeraceae bacterium]